MTTRPPFLVRAALGVVRIVSRLVPRRDRAAWRGEWEAEILHGYRALDGNPAAGWREHVTLGRRALGSFADAAWLRRQLTRDAELLHDVTYALRLYRRAPAVVAIVVGVLAVGIGATTAVFSVVDATMLRPIPFADAERMAVLRQQSPEAADADVAPANFLDWQARTRAFEILAAIEPYSRDYVGGAEPEILVGAQVTEGFFDVFQVEPLAGRLLQADDYAAKRNVVVISYALWLRRFGGQPGVVGRSVQFDGESFEVVGILPPGFEPNVLGGGQEVWTPKLKIEDYERRARTGGYWNVVGKLRATTSLAEAQADLDAISQQLAAEHPRTNASVRARAVTVRTHLANGAERPLALLAIASAFIFVLAIGSVANLQLSLVASRLQEFAVRTALGAARARLMRQVVAESTLVAAFAVALGVLIAWAALSVVRAASPETALVMKHATLSLPVVLFAAGLGLVAAMLASALPVATVLRKRAGAQPHGLLSVRSQAPALYGRSALVVIQIALALVLLVAAALLGRSFTRLLRVDPGLVPQNLMGLQVFVYDRQTTAAKRIQFFGETIERIRALPGIERVGAASTVPFLKADIDLTSLMVIRGRETARADDAPRVYLAAATEDYFRTAGIALRRGRVFDATDTMQTAGVAVVNETAARRFWSGGDPIGSTVEVTDSGRRKTLTVVGVVADLRYGGLSGATRPEVFLPYAQSPSAAMTYVVRTSADPSALVHDVKRAVWSIDPLQTFYDAGAVTDMIAASLRPRLFVLRLALVFAAVGFVVAIAGAYGAVGWALRRRTSEFGVRMALGATGAEIRRHMLGYAVRLASIGIALGLLCALVAGRMLHAFLFELSATDPLTLASVSIALLLAVLAASAVPARRASRIDPMGALRNT